MKSPGLIACLIVLACMFSCSRSAEPVEYGKDDCSYCKMTIVDKRFAAEMIDKKGRVYKFDDIGCMMHYLAENKLPETDMKFFVSDYLQKEKGFLNAVGAVYIQNDFFKSPMGGNTGAFANAPEANILKDSLTATDVHWNELKR